MMKALKNVGMPIYIVLMILGFIFFWPVGLIIFVYLAYNRITETSMPWNVAFWSSGNKAFDEYMVSERDRLNAEKEAFEKFLEEKLSAKDKAEFEEFKATSKK